MGPSPTRIEFDPRLIEDAVFLALRARLGTDPMVQHHRRSHDATYAISDPEARTRRIQALHLKTFTRLGLGKLLTDLIGERPLLNQLDAFVVQGVFLAKEEGSDLFGRPGEQGSTRYTGLLRVRAATLVDAGALTALCRHEFLHVSDMLDPGFAYSPKVSWNGPTEAQKSLFRDRFAVLWDIRIDARLEGESRKGLISREKHWALFERVFGSGLTAQAAFIELFENQGLQHMSQTELMAAAYDPARLPKGLDLPASDWEAKELSKPCPVCGFPTVVWAVCPEKLPGAILSEIRARHPCWTPKDSLCRHCEEMLVSSSRARRHLGVSACTSLASHP